MKKQKKYEISSVKDEIIEAIPFGDLAQKPGNVETSLTKDILNSNSAFPIMSNKEINLESIRYDMPQLKKHKAKIFFVSILPVSIQAAFKSLFAEQFPQYAEEGHGSVFFSGSTYLENVFYNKIETLSSANQFPEILITTDVNSIYHRTSRLLNDRNFETFNHASHSIFSGTNINYASRIFGFIGAEAMVMVVNKAKYETIQPPREWYELLNPALKNSIVFCGDIDFHCNTVFAHYVKEYGYEAVDQLSKNTLLRIHPEEMLSTINSGNKINAAVYVMPYSYAKRIQNTTDYDLIWPVDGAILLPIQVLIRKGAYDKYKEMIRFLMGEEVGKMMEEYGLVSTNPKVKNNFPGSKLNWIGWDFIRNCDMHAMKEDIRRRL